jgi:membrane fusion protein, multidrug efflux system
MPADAKLTLLPMPGPPVVRRVAPQEAPQQLERPGEMPGVSKKRTPSTVETPAPKETKSPAPEETSQSRRRRLIRRGLFALLPFALIAGAYWYVTGGQLMSTDDSYVQADTVGISTDVSGIVQGVEVANNQHVD